MATYAILDENNVVLDIFIGLDESEDIDSEQFYVDLGFGNNIKRTSKSMYAGVHLLGKEPFRMNCAEIGGTYDPVRDAFIPPKPFSQWVIDESTCRWVAPIPEPDNGLDNVWDEESGSWLVDLA